MRPVVVMPSQVPWAERRRSRPLRRKGYSGCQERGAVGRVRNSYVENLFKRKLSVKKGTWDRFLKKKGRGMEQLERSKDIHHDC